MTNSQSIKNNTIVLSIGTTSPYREGSSGEILYPGMFVKINSDGEYTVVPDSTATSISPTTVVVENAYIGGTIDDEYESGTNVMMRVPRRGDIVLTKLTSITDPDLTIGMMLGNDGSGWLRQWGSSDFGLPIGVSLDEAFAPIFPMWVAVLIM